MFAEWIPTPDKHHSKAALVPGTATFTDYSESAKYLQHLLRKQHACIMCSVQPWGNTSHPTSSVWCFSEDCDQKDYSSPQLVVSACWMLLGIALKTTQTILPSNQWLEGNHYVVKLVFKKAKVLHWESLKKNTLVAGSLLQSPLFLGYRPYRNLNMKFGVWHRILSLYCRW